VNAVNGGDNVFIEFVSVCICLCAVDVKCQIFANSSKTVKATDFKFDAKVPRGSPDTDPEKFNEKSHMTL